MLNSEAVTVTLAIEFALSANVARSIFILLSFFSVHSLGAVLLETARALNKLFCG